VPAPEEVRPPPAGLVHFGRVAPSSWLPEAVSAARARAACIPCALRMALLTCLFAHASAKASSSGVMSSRALSCPSSPLPLLYGETG
jgi:hypothetical protein